jgi:tetratricopeptide (TPR) repeat protein
MEREFTEEMAKFAQQQLASAPTLPSGEPNLKLTAPGEKFDIYKVDYKWIALQTNKRELRLAYETVKADGGFPDLLKAVRDRLKVVDPTFKTTEDFNNYSSEYAREVNSDVLDFLRQAKQNDDKLRDGVNASVKGGKRVDPSIFIDTPEVAAQPSQAAMDFAAQLEKKRLAEEKRFMGNESMKSKDYDDAIDHYTRSIELCPEEPASYSNRAMAYLQKKSYAKAIEDSNSCLALQSDYLKAFHRRGKAYQALNKFDLAIKDYQYILERSPEDKNINAALKECRQKLEVQLEADRKTQKAAEEKPKGFRRVAIAESDSDEENHNTTNEKPS